MKFECVEDKYFFYVLELGISEDFFWNKPIASVERVAGNRMAYLAWKANPKTR